ncbi:hypothetical protein KL86PLE_20087 [uncultured Pleomorphomonas sp.]|uniref:Uncharacterized protein n=1 Tax=uncultured Pleomorphomonas sp. TaxID=442121 RepID=A0A212LDI6_9HYPH|nr:hypothetical protein [uncultured Pleomorphomonas sp.]SCM75419.1 hypothetical protein KL86PLE_20087 [uncultured Pleomorphomonas sp.]
MPDPINTWDHTIPAGRGEYDGASWSKLSVIFGDDFERYFLAAYALIVFDEGGALTGMYRERKGVRLWVLAHCVTDLVEKAANAPLAKFGEKQRANLSVFRDFLYFALGEAHPLGLLELLVERDVFSFGLSSAPARASNIRMLKEAINWYVSIPEWERWWSIYKGCRNPSDHRLFGYLSGGAAA